MRKKPNAANITHVLAQLGGGSRKTGGGGMMQGMVNIYKTGYLRGCQDVLEGKNIAISIEEIMQLEEKR